MQSHTPGSAELGRFFRRADGVIRRDIAGETLLVPVKGQLAQLQQIFALNPVAAHVWDCLDGESDLAAVLDGIVHSFEVEPEVARSDLLELVDELNNAELIVAGRRKS